MASQDFFELTDDQVNALNSWPRNDPNINAKFPYAPSNSKGFGDYLRGLEVEAMSQPLAVQLDEAAGSLTYIGEALPGSATSAAVWRVRKMDESGDPELIITFAGGTRDFDKIWDNRLAFSYF